MITCKTLEITASGILLQLVFGIPVVSLSLPFLLEGIQLGLYYGHERIWDKISWGISCQTCHYKEFHEKKKEAGEEHD